MDDYQVVTTCKNRFEGCCRSDGCVLTLTTRVSLIMGRTIPGSRCAGDDALPGRSVPHNHAIRCKGKLQFFIQWEDGEQTGSRL